MRFINIRPSDDMFSMFVCRDTCHFEATLSPKELTQLYQQVLSAQAHERMVPGDLGLPESADPDFSDIPF